MSLESGRTMALLDLFGARAEVLLAVPESSLDWAGLAKPNVEHDGDYLSLKTAAFERTLVSEDPAVVVDALVAVFERSHHLFARGTGGQFVLFETTFGAGLERLDWLGYESQGDPSRVCPLGHVMPRTSTFPNDDLFSLTTFEAWTEEITQFDAHIREYFALPRERRRAYSENLYLTSFGDPVGSDAVGVAGWYFATSHSDLRRCTERCGFIRHGARWFGTAAVLDEAREHGHADPERHRRSTTGN